MSTSNQTPCFEGLEPRLLLTTLVGGDVFEYMDAGGEIVRIALEGDLIVELIAADVYLDPNGDQAILLGDMPGEFTGDSTSGRAGVQILGGIGGADAVDLIGSITGMPDGFSMTALATSDAQSNGESYGFAVTDENGVKKVRLAYLDVPDNAGDVPATTTFLQSATLNDDTVELNDGANPPNATPFTYDATGCAINEATGYIYFAANDSGSGSTLYRVDSNSGETVSIGAINDAGTNLSVTGLAYRNEGDGNDCLYAISVSSGIYSIHNINPATAASSASSALPDSGDPNTNPWDYNSIVFSAPYQIKVTRRESPSDGNPSCKLVAYNFADAAALGSVTKTLDSTVEIKVGDNVPDIQGLAYSHGSLVGVDRSPDDGSRLIRINETSGGGTVLNRAGEVNSQVHSLAADSTGVLYSASLANLIRGALPSLSIKGDDGSSVVESVSAATFAPSATGGLLYFVAREVHTINDEDVSIDYLYSIDTYQPNISSIQNTLQFVDTLGTAETTSITWGNTSNTLYGYHTVEINEETKGYIYDVLGTSPFGSVEVTYNTAPVLDISAIEFPQVEPYSTESHIIAVRNAGASSTLVKIDLTTGFCYDLGPLPDPDDDKDPIRGQDLQGLSWDPIRDNPFTSGTGVLLATDATSGELVMVDYRERFPTADAFALYVSQSDGNSSFSIARVPPVDEEVRPMQPYDGNVGSLRVYDAQAETQTDDDLIVISAPANSGQVYIGALSEDMDPDDPIDDLKPFLLGDLGDGSGVVHYELGVRAMNVDDFPDPADSNNLSAGMVLARSLLDYIAPGAKLEDKLLGQNVDDVVDIVTYRSAPGGSTYTTFVVDIDGRDDLGALVGGDQLFGVDAGLASPTRGKASTTPVNIIDSVTLGQLAGMGAMAIGDYSAANGWLAGDETLFAVYDINNPAPEDDIGGIAVHADMVALTIRRGGQMYGIANPGGGGICTLHKIDRDPTGVTADTDLGRIFINDTDHVENIYALASNSRGQLFVIGEDSGGGNELRLYRLDLIPRNLDGDILTDEILAVEILDLHPYDAALAGGLMVGLAFNSLDELYAVHNNGAGDNNVYQIDIITPGVIAYGPVVVSGGVAADVDIHGIVFGSDDGIYAIDHNNVGADRVIGFNKTTPGSAYEVAAGIAANLSGYAIDTAGLCYSIETAAQDIYVSPGFASMLGTLDVNTGVFTGIDYLRDGSGTQLTGVKSMAFKSGYSSLQPTQDALYVIDENGILYEIDAVTAAAVSTGYTFEDADGAVGIESIVTNSITKTLFGYDRDNGRLVNIAVGSLQPAGAPAGTLVVGGTVATTIGSLRPTISGLTFDRANQRFLTVDNSTGMYVLSNEGNAIESSVLMTLVGYTSNAAVAQNISSALFGGAVTGRVNISGSVTQTFYAGWLLTGDAKGIREGTLPETDSFYVGGDLRNLVVNSSIGTNNDAGMESPEYLTGFDLHVIGVVGQVWALEDIIGSTVVDNSTAFTIPHEDYAPNYKQNEIEFRPEEGDNPEGVAFQAFQLYRTDGSFLNDSFETAQYLGGLGRLAEESGLTADEFVVKGLFQEGDNADYYGISLMAGQTITIEVPAANGPHVGVFDPDGRLITVQESDVQAGFVYGEPFRITADRPGVYRIAIGVAPFDGSVEVEGDVDYSITITDAGNLALGAVKANNNIFYHYPTLNVMGYRVKRGDLGALSAGGYLFSDDSDAVYAFARVDDGDLRTIEAASIGMLDSAGAGTLGDTIKCYPRIGVNQGSMGLIRTTGTGADHYLAIYCSVNEDFQMFDAIGGFWGDLQANGGLGVLRAGSMSTGSVLSGDSRPTVIRLNVDGLGDDGIIDLIDVAGNVGNLNAGGPRITVGPNGDVRYMRVGGEIFQDLYYGGGAYTGVTLNPGQTASIRDDSGGYINIEPVYVTTDTTLHQPIDPHTGNAPLQETLPVLSYRTYGIRGSGGSVLVDVESTGAFAVSANSNGVGSPVQIGKITVHGNGRATELVDGRVELAASPSIACEDNLTVHIVGSTNNPIDVFEIVGGNFTSIRNETGGEIVNITADSVEAIYSLGSLGIAQGTYGEAVNPRVDAASAAGFVPSGYPFVQQHTGIVVKGHVDRISSKGAIGNVMVNGQIDLIRANYDQATNINDGQFDGIAAPIFATGDIVHAYIGEGIAPSGSGEMADAGLFSLGKIRYVTSQYGGAVIRGAIVGEQGVGKIELTNGSIVNADILGATLPSGREYVSETGGVKDMTSDVGNITLTGDGGILGAYIAGQNVGNITVNNGFGLFNSFISTVTGNGQIGNTTVDGCGIYAVMFNTGGDQGNITATGRGADTNTLTYSPSVRYSETETWLPGTNQRLSALNDIHELLKLFVPDPVQYDIDHLCQEGLLESVWAYGNGNLGNVSSYWISSSLFHFANSIRGFRTYPLLAAGNSINSVTITTGSLGFFNPAQDVSGLTMTIAGEITSMNIRGSLLGSSTITAAGPNGNIKYIHIFGNMDGQIIANGILGTLIVDQNMTNGLVEVKPFQEVRTSLNLLRIGGDYTGNIDVQGNVGTIDVRGNLGAVGNTLQINGDLRTLTVGGNMNLDLNVLGDMNTMRVSGAQAGDAWVSGDVRQIQYLGGGAVTGNVTVMGSLRTVTMTGADWQSTLTAGNDLGSVTITNGDLTATGSIICSFGDIRSILIRGGDLFGTVSAPNGTIYSIRVTGSDLGATSFIEAGQINVLRLDGSILAGARIVVDNELRTLWVGGNVEVGSTITVGSTRSLQIQGNLLGDLTLGFSSSRAAVNIRGNVGGDLEIQADTALTISGNINNGATVHVAYDVTSLRVGNIRGNLIVDGEAGTIRAGDLDGGVITVGRDISSLTFTGNVTNSLIQAGINRGDDDDFANVDDNGSQIARMGQIKRLSISGDLDDSIIAAGGAITSASVRGDMDNASISSGLVIGGQQISDILTGVNPMTTVNDLNNARVGAMLLWGDFKTATVSGDMTDSDLTAGVAPAAAAAGAFTLAAVVNTSETGGNSRFGTVTVGGSDNLSFILSDNGIGRDRISGNAQTDFGITYALADIDGGVAVNPLDLQATVTIANSPFTYTNVTPVNLLEVTLRGLGQVRIYDSNTADTIIDTLVIAGANTATRIELRNLNAGTTIGRILTEDDIAVGTLTYDGTLTGIGNALWLDAGVNTFTLNEYAGTAVGGRIGGDVRTMDLTTQGSGTLRIGGQVTRLTIVNGNDPLLSDVRLAAGDQMIAMTIPDEADHTWVFNDVGDMLEEWDISDGGVGFLNDYTVEDALGNALRLTGLAYDGADIIAIADQAWSYAPTIQVGALAGEASLLNGLTGLAVNRDGDIYAAQSADIQTLLGDLGASMNIQAIAVDDTGTRFVYDATTNVIYSVDVDADGVITGVTAIGAGVLREEGVGIIEIESVYAMDIDSNGILYFVGTDVGGGGDMKLYSLDSAGGTLEVAAGDIHTLNAGGAVGEDIRALCLTKEENLLYGVRDMVGSHNLVRIIKETAGAVTAGDTTDMGLIQVRATDNADIYGMDVDVQGNIIAIDKGATFANGGMIRINLVDPTDSWTIGENDTMLADAEGFTTNDDGEFFTVDLNGAGNDLILFSIGRDRLVQIDAATGAFTSMGYFRDIYGSYYFQDVETIAFDNGVGAAANLYGIFRDVDGMGGSKDADPDGAALALIDTTPENATTATSGDGDIIISKPDGSYGPAKEIVGAFTDDFNAMAIDNVGSIFTVRRNGGQDFLMEINLDGTVDSNVLIQVAAIPGADTSIIGMGFHSGNWVAYNNSGASAEQIVVDTGAPGGSTLLTKLGLLNTDIDGFAIGRSGNAFAYNIGYNDDAVLDQYGMVYRSAGFEQSVMGVIDIVADPTAFLQYLPLAQDITGTPLLSSVVGDSYEITSMGYEEVGPDRYAYVTIRNETTGEYRIAQYDATTGELQSFAELADAIIGVPNPVGATMVEIELNPANPQHLGWAVGDVLCDALVGPTWIASITEITGTHTFIIAMQYGVQGDVAAGAVMRRQNVAAIGTVVDSVTGETLRVTKMDFDDGTLIGAEQNYNRLVTINFDFESRIQVGEHTLVATARTEAGSVDVSDVTALAMEENGDEDLYAFSNSDDRFKRFTGTTQNALGGITLGSVRTLNLGGGAQAYQGRIVATGNTFNSVAVTGDFDGMLYTTSSINSIRITGNFSGALYAGESMRTVRIDGAFQEGGLLNAPGSVTNLRVGGAMSGGLAAGEVKSMTVGSLGATADVRVTDDARTVRINGDVDGVLDLGSTSNLFIVGGLVNDAYVRVRGDARTLRVSGNTDLLSLLRVDGAATNLQILGTHRGTLAVDHGVQSLRFGAMNFGIAAIGQNVTTLYVAGSVINRSVISIGTTLGADGLYNTADDRITGGSLRTGTIRGNFTDSALVAGVLPKLADGPDVPLDMRAYTGNTAAANIEDIDSAECGGILPSVITRLTIFGRTGTFGAGNASAVAAEELGTITRRDPWSDLYQRDYNDQIGPPVDYFQQRINNKEIRCLFTQEINTASFILSQDNDGDGDDTGVADVLGSVKVMESGVVLNDVVLSYTTQTTTAGVVEGVLIARRDAGFGATAVVLFMDGPNDYPNPVVYGRSGLRSSLMDLTSEATFTMLNGNPT
ncbi:MAG: hypothetical protein JXA11_00365 [Phycisphaerae bacterium]|nr:hypothetical protein [Phycisphaerae bacterium]